MLTVLDADLLTSYSAGDKEAYAVLLARYHGLVRTACIRQAPPGEVEDCIQAVFLVLMCRPAAAARAPALAAWLMRVTWYVCRAAQRSAKCRRTAEQQAAALKIPPDSTPPEALDHLDDCLARLPERQRAAISLQYLAGKNPDEVARELGVTRDNAYQLVSRGLVALRALLARRGIAVTGTALLTVLATKCEAAAASPAASITLSFTTQPTAGATSLAHGACTAMTITAITPIALAAAAMLLSVVGVSALLAMEVSPALVPVPVVPVAVQVKTPTPTASTPFMKELDGELTFDFQNEPFVEAISFLKRTSKLNIVVDPAVMKRVPEPVTMKVTAMRARNVLGFIERFSGLDHLIKGDAYVIVPADQRAANPPVPRIDLLHIDQCPGLSDRLAQRVTFDFKEVAMTDVVLFLRQITLANVLESPAFRRRTSTMNGVTLKVQDMRFDKALEWVCTLTNTTVSAQSQGLVFDVVPEAGLIPVPTEPEPTAPTSAF